MLWFTLAVPVSAQTLFEVGFDPLYPNVAAAVAAADDGDTIRIYAGLGPELGGVYRESVTLDGLDLTIEGEGDPVLESSDVEGFFVVLGNSTVVLRGVTLDGLGVHRVGRFEDTSHVTLEDSFVRHGYRFGGGGSLRTLDGSTLVIMRTEFDDSMAANAGFGGFLTASGTGVLQVSFSSFRNGRSEGDGGAIYCDTTGGCTIEDSLFVSNWAGSDGGAVAGEATTRITIERSRFCGNTAVARGGAVELHRAARVTYSVFMDNVALADAGALFYNDTGTLVLEHNDFLSNDGMSGAAVHQIAGTLLANHNLFVDHTSSSEVVDLYGPAGSVLAYNLYWNNEGINTSHGDGMYAVTGDPTFTALDYGDCEGSELTLAPGSIALDAGDPTQLDLDGSPADIGAFGPGAAVGSDTGEPAAPSFRQPSPEFDRLDGCRCTSARFSLVWPWAGLLVVRRRRRRR